MTRTRTARAAIVATIALLGLAVGPAAASADPAPAGIVLAQPSGEPTTDPVEPTTDPVEPTTDPVEPTTDPVEPTTDPVEPTTDPVEPTTDPVEPTLPPSGEPTLPPSGEPTIDPTLPPSGEPTLPPSGEPTIPPSGEPTLPPSGEPTLPPSGEPTTPPSESGTPAPTTAPAPPPIDQRDVDIDLRFIDNRDYSVNITDNSTVIFEGNQYSSVYIYTDVDGRTVRGWDLSLLDFETREAALRFYAATGYDPDLWWIFDGDRDGIYIEEADGEFTRDTATRRGIQRGGQVAVWPAGGVSTGGGA